MWRGIGERDILSRLIARITGVLETVLVSSTESDTYDFAVASLATSISWMARRRTTRVEDMSYSLLGILDINMPMPYGERQRAFYRLREEVIRKYNELSIFAWTGPAITTLSLPRRPASSRTTAKSVARHIRDIHLGGCVNTQSSLTNQGVVFPSAKLYSQHQLPLSATNTSATSTNTTAPLPTTTSSPTSVACYSKKPARASLGASKKRPAAWPPSEDRPPSIPAGSQLPLLYPSNTA